jgi:MFS family permease
MLDYIKKYPKPLQLSIIEGMVASLMFGGGTIFIIPFAVFLGANSFQIGLLSAIPALLGAWLQLGSIKLLEVYKKRKNAIVIMVFLQALSWLLIAAIPFLFSSNQVTWLILITTIGTMAGSIGGPLWQSWMRSLTPQEILGEYFGVRNALTGLIVFLTMLGSGMLLDLVEPNATVIAFSSICAISFIGRLLSSLTFTRIEEPEFEVDGTEKTTIFTFIKQLGKDNFGYFVLFGALMTFSISAVGTFFPVYLLETLGLADNYFVYTLIICASSITSLISMPYWGKVVDKFGTIKVLKATGFLACLFPLVYIFVKEPFGLIAFELLGGVLYSGFNLCIANFIYESFNPNKLIKYGGYQGALFGTATFMGIIITGFVMTFNISFFIFTTTFYIVCAISVLLRLIFYSTLINRISDVRKTTPIKNRAIILKVLTFEPVRETLIGSFIPIIIVTENTLKRATDKTILTVKQLEQKSQQELIQTIQRVDTMTKREITMAKEIINKKRKGFL